MTRWLRYRLCGTPSERLFKRVDGQLDYVTKAVLACDGKLSADYICHITFLKSVNRLFRLHSRLFDRVQRQKDKNLSPRKR